jgi:hypothetical protein
MRLLERHERDPASLATTETLALERARDEHERNHQALVSNRFPAWREWVLGTPCQPPSTR